MTDTFRNLSGLEAMVGKYHTYMVEKAEPHLSKRGLPCIRLTVDCDLLRTVYMNPYLFANLELPAAAVEPSWYVGKFLYMMCDKVMYEDRAWYAWKIKRVVCA